VYKEKFRLDGKVAIVTGGGRGLGKQMALALAKNGAAVVVAARSQGQIDDVAAQIKDSGGKALAVPTDITDRNACFALVDAAVREFGGLHVMMNNAGIGDNRPGPQDLLNYPFENWLYTFDVNLNGTFHCTQAAGKRMVEQGEGGSIVNTSSGTALRGNRGNGAYGAAKAAVIAFTKTTAINLAEHRIRANAIVPGYVFQSPPRDQQEADSRLARGRYIASKRLGDAWELGALAVFLAADASSYVSGEIFVIDGGGTAGGYTTVDFAPAYE
jgi:NAD(P)-dependent dehydrogenase (short-subunit alcohol dehydrogenase family)